MELIEKVATIAQDAIDKEQANNPQIKKIMSIVKEFIQEHRVMCYGGTAINNLLPKDEQFYDPEKDIPDYDFFSETPQEHAMILSDRLVKAGIQNVEAKPGMHLGTFKVFAEYTGVADITFLDKPIFKTLWKESITKDKIHYVPPNFLRMSVYLELSRPRGDVSRWKKVYSRLMKLNKHYPVTCNQRGHQREGKEVSTKIQHIFVKEEIILLGLNAFELQQSKKDLMFPLDGLVEPEQIDDVKDKLVKALGSVKTQSYPAYAELLPPHVDIQNSKGELLIRLFETTACHSYHETSGGILLASIPTLLNFFFGIIYSHKHFLEGDDRDRLICVAQTLVSQANGDMKRRFKLLTPLTCKGKQHTLTDMKEEKSELYSELSKHRKSTKFLEYFFSYKPTETPPAKKQALKRTLRKLTPRP